MSLPILETKTKVAHVVLPFEAGASGELSLRIGDFIEILKPGEAGWAVGKRVGTKEKGLFPVNFVEVLGEKESLNTQHELNERGKDLCGWKSI